MNEKLKDQDVLLVKEKGSNELHAVNLDKNGKVKSSKLDGSENPDFLKIDKNGNVLENFFENFKRQIKDPTKFDFYRVPLEKFQEVVQKLQEAFKSPNKPENKDFLDAHRIDPENVLKKQAKEQGQTEGQTKSYAINPDLVDWQKFERFGIAREALEKSGNLDKLLDYQKTNLMPVVMKFDDETLRSDGRFSLKKMEDGSFAPSVHLIRKEPELERPYFGIKFTDEDKKNLLETNNLGRVVNAEFKKGEKTPILLSLDKQTNELVAYRKEWLKIPDTYKNAPLNEEQKQRFANGEKVKVEGMTSTKGTKFDGEVQFDANKRYLALVFNKDKSQNQDNKQGKTTGVYIANPLLGADLNEKQYANIKAGHTEYVKGMKDKEGKEFNAYVKIDAEANKLKFYRFNPDKAKKQGAEVTPDNAHKTQVAVNSEGKTNEATKNAKEPLKQGQTQPTDKQAAKQEEKKEVKKSKGVKM